MYWEYAGTRYEQKFKALEAAGRFQNQVTAHFSFDSFKAFDWSSEPAASLDALMTERCFQLRDKYSYLKFYLSGGSDSTTVFNCFIKNNIHIDEIVCWRFSVDNNFDCLSNYEINKFTLPYLRKIQNQLPKTKIKVLDIGKDYFDSIMSEKFFFSKNTFDLREMYFPKIRGKNFCHILGSADPFIEYHNGTWYEVMYDTNSIGEYRYRNIECFFTTPDLPELHAKQSHILKNVYKKLNRTHLDEDNKQLIEKYLRDTPIAPRIPAFIKPYKGGSLYSNPKNTLLVKNASKDFKDRYKSIFTTVISGTPAYRLLQGIEIDRYDLGA